MPVHSILIKLDRARNVYHQGEHVSGQLILDNSYELRHDGILLTLEGYVDINANLKGINLLFDTFNSTSYTRNLPLVDLTYELVKPGRLEIGKTIVPFKIPIDASVDTPTLFETYHGVYISIQYFVRCRIKRPIFSKDLIEEREIVLEYDSHPIGAPAHVKQAIKFEIKPDSLSAALDSRRALIIPDFRITGQLDSCVWLLDEPITGEFQIESCQATIKSIELQLVRVETIGGAGGAATVHNSPSFGARHIAATTGSRSSSVGSGGGGGGNNELDLSRETTEIQSIQIGDGDLLRNVPISIYMVLPRLFTCATLVTNAFRIEFEINLVIIFADNHLMSENFPIKLIRSTLQPINNGFL